MNQVTINALEFDKIRKILSTFTTSPLGSGKAENITPQRVREEVIKNLQLVKECMTFFQAEGDWSCSGAEPIGHILDKARIKGSVLEIFDFLQIAQNVEIAQKIKSNISKSSFPSPLMKQQANCIPDLRALLKEIRDKIDPNGEIPDTASQKLRSIRKSLRSAKKKVQSTLHSMLESHKWQKTLQESLITIRNERFVIPIKAEHRAAIDGVVQDKSVSGATLFIEPLSIVKDNNRLSELRAEEKAEIIRILSELTELIRTNEEALHQVEKSIAEFDLLGAKAKFGIKLKCSIPSIGENKKLLFQGARHPLLDLTLRENIVRAGIPSDLSNRAQDVVPISLSLSQKENTMVITGPNTGGKTVALKTVGLLTMMSQAGIPVPATEVEMPIFHSIFADIGDQQSIVQNLSTFSSHLNNIIVMMNEIEQPALILLDEIGAGTDPSEGAALGLAILNHFHKLGSYNLITTHHNAIKVYAYSQEGVSNASVEFDEKTLQPTYKLIQGIPGRSNAFKIAKRLGLHQELLNLAETFIEKKDYHVDQFIKKLEEKYASLEERESKIKNEALVSQQRRKELLQNLDKTLEREEEIASQSLLQWRELKEEFVIEARTLFNELRQKIDNAELIKQAREEIEAITKKYESKLPKAKKKRKARIRVAQHLFKGDLVRVVSLNQTGTVCEEWDKIDKKDIVLIINKKKIRVKPNDTELISRAEQDETIKKSGRVKLNVEAKSGMSREINLHGCTVEEALSRTGKFLDDALLAHLNQVRIVHGIGTGKLRNAITEMLKNESFVENFRTADPREGGEGVTIVELAS